MPRGRPKKNPLPEPFYEGMAVKVRCSEYKEPKLGLIHGWCRYNDGGIYVWLTAESTRPKDGTPGVSKYVCIQTERGDTIEGIQVDRVSSNPK